MGSNGGSNRVKRGQTGSNGGGGGGGGWLLMMIGDAMPLNLMLQASTFSTLNHCRTYSFRCSGIRYNPPLSMSAICADLLVLICLCRCQHLIFSILFQDRLLMIQVYHDYDEVPNSLFDNFVYCFKKCKQITHITIYFICLFWHQILARCRFYTASVEFPQIFQNYGALDKKDLKSWKILKSAGPQRPLYETWWK